MSRIERWVFNHEAFDDYIRAYEMWWEEPENIPVDAYSMYDDLGIDIRGDYNLHYDLTHDFDILKTILDSGLYDYLFTVTHSAEFVSPEAGVQYRGPDGAIYTIANFSPSGMLESAVDACRGCVGENRCVDNYAFLVLIDGYGNRETRQCCPCGYFFDDWIQHVGTIQSWREDGTPGRRVSCPEFEWD